MRWWFVLCTLLSLSAPGKSSGPADMTQFWRQSPINLAFMHDYISNAKCQSTPLYLSSCRAAVEEAKKMLPISPAGDDFEGILAQVEASHDVKMPKQLVFGRMLNAHLKTFDAHAFILPAGAVEAMLGSENRGRFGIGLHFLPTVNAGMFVGSVTPNSPASAAGVAVGDRLLSVGDKPVAEGTKALDMFAQMGGRPGDVIALEVERDGQIVKFKIPVGVIDEENVTAGLVDAGGTRYVYVRVRQFRDSTCSAVKTKISPLVSQAHGLILDLRDNLGGRLDEGICLANLFVGEKKIVGEKLVDIKIPVYASSVPKEMDLINWQEGTQPAAFAHLPMVVLVNPISASASEIVAGALQDSERAWVVGEPSFGKGTIQAVRPLSDDPRFSVGFTVALFYRPNGNTNQLVGVSPNFPAPYRPGAPAQERAVLRELEINPNALHPSGTVTAWKDNRSPQAEKIAACIASSAKDMSIYKGLKTSENAGDYQKAYALAVLDCSSVQHNTLASQE